jgi:hypothetical protein
MFARRVKTKEVGNGCFLKTAINLRKKENLRGKTYHGIRIPMELAVQK